MKMLMVKLLVLQTWYGFISILSWNARLRNVLSFYEVFRIPRNHSRPYNRMVFHENVSRKLEKIKKYGLNYKRQLEENKYEG